MISSFECPAPARSSRRAEGAAAAGLRTASAGAQASGTTWGQGREDRGSPAASGRPHVHNLLMSSPLAASSTRPAHRQRTANSWPALVVHRGKRRNALRDTTKLGYKVSVKAIGHHPCAAKLARAHAAGFRIASTAQGCAGGSAAQPPAQARLRGRLRGARWCTATRCALGCAVRVGAPLRGARRAARCA